MNKLLTVLGGAVAALAVVVTVPALAGTHAEGRSDMKLEKLKYFVDVHDRANRTFPERITKEELAKFVAAYEEACRAEGVVLLRLHVNLEVGRAYCLTAAPSAEAVKRAHERVGLPFDGITEVQTVTPGDLFP
jgi:hypothetical protein